MSIFLCRAVVTKSFLNQSPRKTEMQTETEMFEAQGAELAREARRQSIARLAAPVARTWGRTVDRLTRASRAAQQRKDLLERMETMPAYMLKDIGVSRDQAGRFCFTNDYGMLVDLAPVPEKKPAAWPTVPVGGGALAYAAR
jgi:uncharacterized protein YjiS (DUF1127 family)